MSSERPLKRVRQACEPCRRKKSRCPGEKPNCSHCARLRQDCFYADEREGNERSSTPPPQSKKYAPTNDVRLEDRLRFVESQLAEVLAGQSNMSRSTSHLPDSPRTVLHQPVQQPSPRPLDANLPQWETILSAAGTYLAYCDCQPLPLFHRSSFLQTLRDRDAEVLFAILALTVRFTDEAGFQEDQSSQDRSSLIARYVEAATGIVMKKVVEGSVELSTVQSLCLISIVNFTDGDTRRASIHSSLAMTLAHNAGLTTETHLILPTSEKEERRRCFWSLFILKRLHGADFMILDFSAEDNFPWYPETTANPLNIATPGSLRTSNIDPASDKGIVAYAIQLSEVWFKITRYARRRGKPSNLPPWSSTSEYSTILANQMDFETRMPYIHRFEPAKFSQRTLEHLNSNRDYWGPWLFIQFLYHTNLCLLNHPLFLSLRLKNFKCVIPEIFLQHTSDLISSHASWIINYIDMLEAKGFKVTDPFIGHCVAIVATIYLQESFVDDAQKRGEKVGCFEKCLRFIRDFGRQWPHVSRIADKLQRLAETVSYTYVASEEPTRQNRKLLMDLGQFFEVLEYSSSSEVLTRGRGVFGRNLHEGLGEGRTEMAQTSVLPEPTRVERQEFGSTSSATPVAEPANGFEALGAGMGIQMGADGMGSGIGMVYSDDELAVLAESFFHQGNNGPHGGDVNWWNTLNP